MSRNVIGIGILAALAAAISALPSPVTAQAAADADMVAAGKDLVEAHCSPCHAVGPAGDSPHPAAPPFRDLQDRYPVESIEEALVEGIATGHPEMPEFVFDPHDAAAIIVYLRSLPAAYEPRRPHTK